MTSLSTLYDNVSPNLAPQTDRRGGGVKPSQNSTDVLICMHAEMQPRCLMHEVITINVTRSSSSFISLNSLTEIFMGFNGRWAEIHARARTDAVFHVQSD